MSIIVNLDSRSQSILRRFTASNDYIAVNDLAREESISRRSVYYAMQKINDWLDVNQIPRIDIQRSKGICISNPQRKMIEEVLSRQPVVATGYVYSPTERVRLITCLFINCCTPIFIEDLTEYCQVSRNTIFNDLKTITAKLQKYDLELTYEPKTGYQVAGETIRKRALFFYYFSSLSPLFVSGIPKFFGREEIKKYYGRLEELEVALGTKYVHGTLLAIAALLPVMAGKQSKLDFLDVEVKEILTTKEFALVQEFFPELVQSEQCYLCLHLLGSRLQSVPIKLLKVNQDNEVYEMSVELVREFERVACVELGNKGEIERALFAHLKTSLYRYRYGIQFGNPLTEDIIREYPSLFQITRKAACYLEKRIGLPILEGEIAYLTMHFGGFLRSVNQQNNRLRVLIVCPNGISTGNMLRGEIVSLLPNAEIVDVVASTDIINVEQICDIVISTVKVRSSLPVVVVHPILTDEDRMAVLKKGMRNNILFSSSNLELEPLFKLVSKYVPKEQHNDLREDLSRYLNSSHSIMDLAAKEQSKGILDILDVQRISIFEEVTDWRFAIHNAADTLLQAGSITPNYIEKIILSLEVYGPYMFLSPGLVLAHAKPSDGVQRLDLSITVFKTPIPFTEDHFARVLIVLAAVDGEKHLKILKDIIAVFGVQSHVDMLAACNTPQQVLDFFRDNLESQ